MPFLKDLKVSQQEQFEKLEIALINLKLGQNEQSENIEKRQKELNLKVIENLDTKIEVRCDVL